MFELVLGGSDRLVWCQNIFRDDVDMERLLSDHESHVGTLEPGMFEQEIDGHELNTDVGTVLTVELNEGLLRDLHDVLDLRNDGEGFGHDNLAAEDLRSFAHNNAMINSDPLDIKVFDDILLGLRLDEVNSQLLPVNAP